MVSDSTSASAAAPSSAQTGRIIVAWDGSSPARGALDWALARAAGHEVSLVRVVDRTLSTAEYVVPDSTVEAARVAMAAVARRAQEARPEARVTTNVVAGDPVEELRRLSAPDALVVVGTHKRDGPTVRYTWSVGARLAGVANGPVAIIPEPESTADTAGTPGTGIVVGIDGSATSDLAVAFAAEEANRTEQALTVIHAWQEPLVWRDTTTPDTGFIDDIASVHERTLAGAVTALQVQYPRLTIIPSLVRGTAAWALLDAARSAALLVVGNHGMHGVKRLLLGSVSHAVVLNIQSPTVVISVSPRD